MSRSKWIPRAFMEHILAALTVENEEALRISMDYGARIGDVLAMPRRAAETGLWSYREEKTHKRRRVRLSKAHCKALLSFAGELYCFEHRLDWRRHRTRQAVYKDLRRAAEFFRVEGVSPHSGRKIYAVEKYRANGGDLRKVEKLLNHSSEAVTMLYALADEMSKAKSKVTKR